MGAWLRGHGIAGLGILALAAGSAGAVRAAEGPRGAEVYQRALPSTVWVFVPVSQEGGRVRAMTGAGSLIDVKHKLILTNYHVVGDKDKLVVYFPMTDKGEVVTEKELYRRRGTAIPGKVIAKSTKADLALIQLVTLPPGARALPLARKSAMPGATLHSIGNPGVSSALWVYTSGSVRQVHHNRFPTGSGDGEKFEVDARVIETSSPVNKGDSGGPVLNDNGELVGVTQGFLSGNDVRLVSIAIDIREVWDLLASKKIHITGSAAPTVAEKPQPAPVTKPVPAAVPAEDDPAEKAERMAAQQLRFAKSFDEGGLTAKARERYRDIVKKYPKTKAAADAEKRLQELEDK